MSELVQDRIQEKSSLPKRRCQVPIKNERGVLVVNRHTCCICHRHHKRVQIHHINGKHSDNRLDNLAVLCLDHHSDVTGPQGLGKAYTAAEVRMYKRNWEGQIRRADMLTRQMRGRLTYRKELLTQVDIICAKIVACEKDKKKADELLAVLFYLRVFQGDRALRRRIVEGLDNVAMMVAMQRNPTASLIPENVWLQCCEFVGPDEVSMNASKEKHVLQCVKILQTFNEFNCMLGHNGKGVDEFIDYARQFFDMAWSYRKRRVANGVVMAVEKGLDGCRGETGQVEYRYGRNALRRCVRSLIRVVRREGPRWNRQRTRLEKLLNL